MTDKAVVMVAGRDGKPWTMEFRPGELEVQIACPQGIARAGEPSLICFSVPMDVLSSFVEQHASASRRHPPFQAVSPAPSAAERELAAVLGQLAAMAARLREADELVQRAEEEASEAAGSSMAAGSLLAFVKCKADRDHVRDFAAGVLLLAVHRLRRFADVSPGVRTVLEQTGEASSKGETGNGKAGDHG